MSDPNEIKDWVVSSSGFWYKGEVNKNEYVVPFRGTWHEVKARHNAMREMEILHYEEREQLKEQQRKQRKKLWSNG